MASGPSAAVNRVELFLPVESSYNGISDFKIGDRVVDDMYPDISEKRPEGLLRVVSRFVWKSIWRILLKVIESR